MEQLLKFIVDHLIGPENEILSRQEDSQLVFEVRVPPDKVGQLIGKQGRIVKAIRTLLNIHHLHHHTPSSWRLDIVSSEEPKAIH